MSSMFVVLDFRGYWLHTTGESGGADMDLVADRDEHGFPILRGRHCRGVIREASRRVEAWGHAKSYWKLDAKLTEILFGEGSPGALDVRDFHLPDEVRADPELSVAFFRRMATTAIDWQSGVARNKTLRAVEACVPCVLGGWISWAPVPSTAQSSEKIAAAKNIWIQHIRNCLIEARAFGASRTRGYGYTRFVDPVVIQT